MRKLHAEAKPLITIQTARSSLDIDDQIPSRRLQMLSITPLPLHGSL